jgi:hypothetical protein
MMMFLFETIVAMLAGMFAACVTTCLLERWRWRRDDKNELRDWEEFDD